MLDKIQSIQKILRSSLFVLFIFSFFSCLVLLSYQSFILRCQPNCAQKNLQGVYLHRPFTKADSLFELVLRNVDFQEADFREANLKSVFIRKSNFQGANLQNAVLHGADLAWSDFDNANLRHANLKLANLYGASLQNTDLRGANLENASLVDTILTGAKYDDETVWPHGFDLTDAKAIVVE